MSLQIQQEDFGICPSFNSYSTGTIADAARRAGGYSFFDFDRSSSPNKAEEQADDDDDFEFEFVSLQKSGGLIAPAFPIFNSELQVERAEIEQPIRIPLEKLLIRDPPSPSSSSSSSSVDELEGIPSGSYCVWKPKPIGTPNLACKKSRSTGSSSTKRWGIRDLLRRSHSDGKKSYVSFTAKEMKSEKKELKEKKVNSGGKTSGRIFSAHESFYVRNRTLKEEGKRKSYLPYKPELVACWTNVSGLGRANPLGRI